MLNAYFLLSSFVGGHRTPEGLASGRLGLFLTFSALGIIMFNSLLEDIQQGKKGVSFWLGLVAVPGLLIGTIGFLQAFIFG